MKEEQRVYRLQHDTGWRINNCITDGGARRRDNIRGSGREQQQEDRNPLSGITRQSGTHQRAYFYNYCRRPLMCLKPTVASESLPSLLAGFCRGARP